MSVRVLKTWVLIVSSVFIPFALQTTTMSTTTTTTTTNMKQQIQHDDATTMLKSRFIVLLSFAFQRCYHQSISSSSWKYDVNITRIESRIDTERPTNFDFFVDFHGQVGDANVDALLGKLGGMTDRLLVLDEKEVRVRSRRPERNDDTASSWRPQRHAPSKSLFSSFRADAHPCDPKRHRCTGSPVTFRSSISSRIARSTPVSTSRLTIRAFTTLSTGNGAPYLPTLL
jgi:hypothetical protein